MAASGQVLCVLGNMIPGTVGTTGTKSAAYVLTFEALAATNRTMDSVIARVYLDCSGPAAPTTLGPATDGVAIIALPTSLPEAGIGPVEDDAANTWQLLV